VRRADNLTAFMCRLSRNSGASPSWNPKGLSRPVAGKLYLLFLSITFQARHRHMENKVLMFMYVNLKTLPVTQTTWHGMLKMMNDENLKEVL
jgi:hypothetical protein